MTESPLFPPLPALAGLFLVGLGLGLFYFGGLWLTLQQITRSRQPAMLLLSSFVARSAICVGGLFMATGGQWERLAVCVTGFVTMRMLLTRWLGLRPQTNE